MNAAIAHRGPDDEGVHVQGEAGLGHRRLSIIDLEGGRQPLSNEDGSIWVVFNGEIYNFPGLRAHLMEQGHVFATRTDTEVIVHLYEELGEDFVERLSGMFALALWDAPRQRLLLARDRIGQKPLFYSEQGERFLFASEVKAILAARGVERRLDMTAMHHYLGLRFIPPPHTMLQGVNKLPPGHLLVREQGRTRIRRYWDLDFTDKLDLSEDEMLEGLDQALGRAVESHLISDVRVGAFLSGGMDSSTIVALMARFLDAPFPTFAIGVQEEDFNELPYARLVAERYRTEHHETMVSADLVSLTPLIVHHLDEPSDSIAACMYQSARLAGQHVKVVMGGDGGDELFAGFDRYLGVGYINLYAALPGMLRRLLLRPLIRALPDSFTYKSFVQKLRWMDELADHDAGRRYAEATTFFRFSHERKARLFGESVWQDLRDQDSSDIIVRQYDRPNARLPLDRMLYADFMTRLTDHTLMLTDRLNMAFGVEARSPFLDHDLVEYLARFPPDMKIRGRRLKYALRRLAEPLLPREITQRPKQGFIFPVAYWLRGELHPFVSQTLEESFFVREGIFRREAVQDLLERHRAGREDNSVRLWMLLNMEVWHRIYMEGQDPADLGRDMGRAVRESTGDGA